MLTSTPKNNKLLQPYEEVTDIKTLLEGDKNVIKLLGVQKLQDDTTYRLSDYVVFWQNEDKLLIRNTLSGSVILLKPDEIRDLPFSKGMEVEGWKTKGTYLQELVFRHFMVPKDSQEHQKYTFIKIALKNARLSKSILRNFVIFPTTACNARCIYCYEKGMIPRTMTLEKADAVSDFICRSSKGSKVMLTWFGGEPLVGIHIIRHIVTRLSEKGVDFSSKMITNASLLTPEIVREAKATWHLGWVQVSSDGVRDDYEQRKQYLQPKLYNYDTLIQAVHALLDEGIEVSLRCNYDKDNLPGMKAFVSEINKEFHGSPMLSLYFAMLYQQKGDKECIKVYRDMYALMRYLDAAGVHYRKPLKLEHPFKVSYCIGDALGESVVIDPDARIFLCDNLMEHDCLGSVEDKNLMFSKTAGVPAIHQDCMRCPYLPTCTPFRRNGCPDWFPFCREFREIETEYYFEQLGKNLDVSINVE